MPWWGQIAFPGSHSKCVANRDYVKNPGNLASETLILVIDSFKFKFCEIYFGRKPSQSPLMVNEAKAYSDHIFQTKKIGYIA